MIKSYWRIKANEIIIEIIKGNPTMAEQPLRKLITEAYPFGERAMHPYKIWCSAVQENLWVYRRIGKKPGKVLQEQEVKTLFD
jgi:hypothetical protein